MKFFLSQEEMWDMPIQPKEGEKHIPHWVGNILYVVFGFIGKVFFRYKVEGKENLRHLQGKTGAVVVCNHTSYLDVVFLYLTSRPKQWIRFLAKDDLFEVAHGFIGWVVSHVGGIPIKRDSADRKAIKRAAGILKRKELVGIFPEATRRNKTDRKPELHAGAAFIARMGKAPLLPATVRNAEKVKEKGKMMRFPKITVEYGKPIELSEFDFLPKEERLQAATWFAMRQSFAMFYRCSASEVDMKALFPDEQDFSEVFASHPIAFGLHEESVDNS